jgi:hypothetical protein
MNPHVPRPAKQGAAPRDLPARGAPRVARSMGNHGAPRCGEFLSTPCRRIVGS